MCYKSKKNREKKKNKKGMHVKLCGTYEIEVLENLIKYFVYRRRGNRNRKRPVSLSFTQLTNY